MGAEFTINQVDVQISRSLSAGGTVQCTSASNRRKAWLALELVALFVVAPLGANRVIHGAHIPLFFTLVPVLFVVLALLAADRNFLLRTELARGFSRRTLLSIVALFAIAGGALTAWVLTAHPDWFLEFPRRSPETYKRIMILYPLASVAAQELIYRTFYFHRYGPLFGAQHWLAILLNGALFGFAHIVIGTSFAIGATALSGTVLAARYAATRSYWAVFLEHTLWGWLIFTIGLGRYFFTGVSNV